MVLQAFTIHSESILLVIGSFVAGMIMLGAIFGAWEKIFPNAVKPIIEKFVHPRRNRTKKIDELIDSFSAQQTALKRIESELGTNGGRSLKDTVNRIDIKVEYLTARAEFQDETSQEAIFELNAHGELTKANVHLCEMLDVDEKEILYKTYLSRLSEQDRPRMINEIKAAIENKMPLDIVVTFKSGTFSKKTIRFIAKPNIGTGATLYGFFGRAELMT